MSTLPFMLSVADELDNLTNRSYLDDFGLGFYPHRHYHRNPSLQLSLPAHSEWLEQRKSRRHIPKEPTSTDGTSGFQVCMDVQQFKPNELTVKTVENCVVVEAKHSEREDGEGYISRQFVRRYELPEGYDPEEVVSTLSSDGILTVTVPPPTKSLEPNERVIRIQHIGPAHLSVKDNATNEANGEAEHAGKDE